MALYILYTVVIFLVANFFHFEIYIQIRIFCCKFPLFLKKIINSWGKKITKNCHNCLQHERVLEIFLVPYFEYCQIWLHIPLNDCHLGNITQKKKKNFKSLNKKRYYTVGFNFQKNVFGEFLCRVTLKGGFKVLGFRAPKIPKIKSLRQGHKRHSCHCKVSFLFKEALLKIHLEVFSKCFIMTPKVFKVPH